MNKRTISLAGMLLAPALLTGCATNLRRPQITSAQACPIRLLPIPVEPFGQSAAAAIESAPPAPESFAGDIETALRQATRRSRVSPPESADGTPPAVEVLVLSGGGKWGAFGAGFLQSWLTSAPPPRPAEFAIVTGISTGALQASFAFLANRQVPTTYERTRYDPARDLALPEGSARPGQGRRYIDDLPLAYTVSQPETLIVVYKGGLLTAARKGSGADLAPLRTRLRALFDPDVMRAIAEGAAAGRKLYVGIVDMDDGQPYAADMTKLAQDWLAAGLDVGPQPNGRLVAPTPRQDQLRDCYTEVLMASSSEPMVALPVFVRPEPRRSPDAALLPTRMYMDGGMRHGVFLQEVMNPRRVARVVQEMAAGGKVPSFNTTVLVNGRLSVNDFSVEGKENEEWQRQWSLLSLLDRTKSILAALLRGGARSPRHAGQRQTFRS